MAKKQDIDSFADWINKVDGEEGKPVVYPEIHAGNPNNPMPAQQSTSYEMCADSWFDSPPERAPEYGLLAGILELTFRDLNELAEPADRKAAIVWFENTGYSAVERLKKFKGDKACTVVQIREALDARFTFEEIADHLDLGLREIEILMTAVEGAKRYERLRLVTESNFPN